MTSPPRILVCDHRGLGLGAELAFLAEEGYEVEATSNLRATLGALAAERPALLVVAPLLPARPLELAALEEARRGDPPVPLLVVAHRDDSAAAQRFDRLLAGGDWDLIWHGAPREEFALRVEGLRRRTQLMNEVGELRHRASHDDRTDLLRPKAFQARLLEHFSAAQRHKLSLALVLIDLDRFGSINKEFDHTVGDELIARVGEVIRRTLRTEDVAGRLGGDEFGVLLPYTRKIDAARVVNRLREEIHALSGRFGAAEIQVSASLGFETFDGTDLDSPETLRHHAEKALRRSKRDGGDRGVYFRSLADEEPATP